MTGNQELIEKKESGTSMMFDFRKTKGKGVRDASDPTSPNTSKEKETCVAHRIREHVDPMDVRHVGLVTHG